MIGLLKHRLQVRQKQKTDNGRGGMQQSIVDKGEIWAAIMPLSTNETINYRQAESQANARIILRKRDDVDNNTILENSKMRYEVEEINESGDYLTLICIGEAI